MRAIIVKLKKLLRDSESLSKYYSKLHGLKQQSTTRKIVKKLKQLEKLDSDAIKKIQDEMLIEMLEYAYTNTKYYKNLFDENDINHRKADNYKRIPFLTKEIVRTKGESILSKKFSLDEIGKRNTGGSTGEPLEFYCDTPGSLREYAHHRYLYSLFDFKKGDLVVSCGGFEIPKRLRDNNIFWIRSFKGNLFGEYRFSVLYINDENTEFYVKKILELKPAVLRGYPSFFYILAKYIQEHKIPIDFEIKGINLTSEMCADYQRELIETVFSSMVYFEYGHVEISAYCYTKDKSYVYYSAPIYGYIEILNDDGTDTNIGDIGNIVVTGFNNRAMPFIRYKTGDLGKLKFKNGGVVQLEKIYGRAQDFILTKNGQKVFLTALIFGQHFKAFARITKWQIVQEKIGSINVKIVKGKEYSLEDEDEIIEKITGVADIDIVFEYVENIEKTKRGKHLFFIQKAVDSNI